MTAGLPARKRADASSARLRSRYRPICPPRVSIRVASTSGISAAKNSRTPAISPRRRRGKPKAAGTPALAAAAARAGVPAAFGFPLLLRGEMAGVLEFFAAEIPDVDATLIETLGGQIGLYVERKRAEEASARFLAGSPAVIYALRLTPDGFRISWYSENIHSLTGYTHAEVQAGDPQHWWEQSIHPDDLPRVVAADRAVLDEGHATIEFRFRRKDGSWLWVHDLSLIHISEPTRRTP